jgi:DNA-binding transcriptional LysR family regulator
MPFDLSQVIAFTTVAREGSLGRAATALGVTQPALSRMIMRLEHKLGGPLFERYSRGMLLTDTGTAFLRHAHALQTDADRAIEEIRALNGLARGTVRIGTIASVACSVLPRAIGAVLRDAPQMKFEVTEGVWDVLSAALVRRDIDLAFAVEVADTDEIVAIRSSRWTDEMRIVASCDHPLRENASLALERLLAEPWALPPRGTGPQKDLETLFSKAGLGMPNIVVETRSITMLKSLVMMEGFLSLMADTMFCAERQAGRIDILLSPTAQIQRSLVPFRRRRGQLPGPSSKLLKELAAIVQSG